MAKLVLVVVDDEDASRQALTEELQSRYGSSYQIVSAASPDAALARLEGLRAEGTPVPLVLADQWMPGMTGTQFLARVKQVISTARRGLLVSWAVAETFWTAMRQNWRVENTRATPAKSGWQASLPNCAQSPSRRHRTASERRDRRGTGYGH